MNKIINNKKGFVIPLVITIIAVLAISVWLYYYANYNEPFEVFRVNPNETPLASTTIVGGDKDIHGCIGSAGYSWCVVKNKCLRVWEETCEAVSTSTVSTSTCSCPDGYIKEGDACNPKCYYSTPKCLMPSIQCTNKIISTTTNPVACTMDAKMCPDGTYVGRSGPNCEFVCPSN